MTEARPAEANPYLSRFELLALGGEFAIDRFLAEYGHAEALRWYWQSRPQQRPPVGDWGGWLILSGRGWGKSRTGAEWTKLKAREERRGILIGRTSADVRDVMVEGESGILSCCDPSERPIYVPSRRRLNWPNGAVTMTYSADEPDQLRGPQSAYIWADELAAWKQPVKVWDNAMFGHRLGKRTQWCVTTTPRPLDILREMVADPTVVLTGGSSYENLGNLAGNFRRVLQTYEGTSLGDQEIYGHILDSLPGALWDRSMIDRVGRPLPDARRVVVGVDPSGAGSATSSSDEIGIVVVSEEYDRPGYGIVLDDLSMTGRPEAWGQQVATAFRRWRADCVVAERNFGGDMVRSTIHAADPGIPVELVTASKGKAVRAAPISRLYEREKIRHYGTFERLEAQLQLFTGSGYKGSGSPDRADALIWGLYWLFVRPLEQSIDVRTLGPDPEPISPV